VVKMTSFVYDIPNKMDFVPVKFMKADEKAKRICSGTPPNFGR
jgi:hypothetical protein